MEYQKEESKMINFLIGFFVGGILGMLGMSLAVMARLSGLPDDNELKED
jgi:hypothetical protein